MEKNECLGGKWIIAVILIAKYIKILHEVNWPTFRICKRCSRVRKSNTEKIIKRHKVYDKKIKKIFNQHRRNKGLHNFLSLL